MFYHGQHAVQKEHSHVQKHRGDRSDAHRLCHSKEMKIRIDNFKIAILNDIAKCDTDIALYSVEIS